MSDRTNRTTVKDIRRAALDTLFHSAYQIESEAQLGDGTESDFYKTWTAEQETALKVLALLLEPDEVAESLATAQRSASARVNGD